MENNFNIDQIFANEQQSIDDYYANLPSESPQDGSEPQLPQSTDVYQKNRTARLYDARNNTFPRGSSQKIMMDIHAVLRQLVPAYKQAKNDSDLYRKRGDVARAEMVKQQYYEDNFLPAIEAVIDRSSVDELLNSRDALAQLDKYATLGNTAGTGFVAAYVKQLHPNDRGNFSGRSDAYVMERLGKIGRMVENGQIRLATSTADKLLEQIDRGEHLATEDDYNILVKVSARG